MTERDDGQRQPSPRRGSGHAAADRRDFEDIDRAADPAALLAYLDAVSGQRSAQEYKHRSFAMMSLRPGDAVLDVGCGTGDDVLALASHVGREGWVVGVDSSRVAVAEARRRSEGAEPPVEFLLGDAHHLPFLAGRFDSARSDRVLQHLGDPGRALAELIRVTRPRGRVVVADTDWDTLVVDTRDRDITRAIVRARADAVANGWSGRRLHGMLADAAMLDVEALPVSVCLTSLAHADHLLGLREAAQRAAGRGDVSGKQAARWIAEIEDADRRGRFFSGITGYVVAGGKPAHVR